MSTTLERPNCDIALRYWSDPTLKAWYWYEERWFHTELPTFEQRFQWHVGHEAPTDPPQKTCVLAGVEFPMPMTEAPEMNSRFWVAMFDCVGVYRWTDQETDNDWLKRGRCQATKEGATQQNRAIDAAIKQAMEAAK